MRESFVQCDHCHDRVKEHDVRGNFFQDVTVVVETGCMGRTTMTRGQLCEGCERTLLEDIKLFFAGPEAVA